MVWTIRQARQHGRSALMTTIAIWCAAGVLTALAGTAWFMVGWRSSADASPEQLTGSWTTESPDGTATIELRPDGSAVVAGVPSEAAWSDRWPAAEPGLPEVLSGEGVWDVPSEELELTCADGRTLRLWWQTVESPTGAMYLQVIAGDPDAPDYFGEFSRVDERDAPSPARSSGPAC
ncbi:hypothetical protein [Agromyces arachidis]|uniref:hypothetical protein n=1 Tax=Agromyces arachidis TaxID=766966 RepID=UPI004057A72B